MHVRKLAALVLVALLALMAAFVPLAEANDNQEVSLYTAPMIVPGNRTFTCTIVNVSNQTRTVTILLSGALPGTPLTLAAGQAKQLTSPPGCNDGSCGGGFLAYCAFQVQGDKKDFRAAACVVVGTDTVVPPESINDPLACLTAQ